MNVNVIEPKKEDPNILIASLTFTISLTFKISFAIKLIDQKRNIIVKALEVTDIILTAYAI